MKSLMLRFTLISLVVLGCALTAAAQQSKKEFDFRGTIEKVDAQAKKLTVNGEKVEGWMQAMTMDYKVDKEEVLASLKTGDRITAKVYDGDFQTLHNVKKAPASGTQEPSKK